ncbi:MAG: gephyrin-like molybdotransferase Glp [Bryobacteraceae bacterium]
MAVPFEEARSIVLVKVRDSLGTMCVETVRIDQVAGRVLAEDTFADRDYPPFPRSARDGFAVRSGEVPGTLRIAGEVRAGSRYKAAVGPGETVEIMTGAPMPEGADAVVMVENTRREGDSVVIERGVRPGENFNPKGAEVRMGEVVVQRGTRLDYAHVAMLAGVGCVDVPVVVKPRVAIVATGDEIVAVGETPAEYQIRNSNSESLAAQVSRAGGLAIVLPVAPDRYDETRALVEKGLEADLLLLSGGVSAGKYDIVEKVLADLGAEFFFDRVRIQPGQPLVFGRCKKKFFFGLPGNPSSTMVTFEAVARLALDLLCGVREPSFPLTYARLTAPFRQKAGLTRFLPATLAGSYVTPESWHGSGDVAALARVNAFLVSDPDQESWMEGDLIRVMPR